MRWSVRYANDGGKISRVAGVAGVALLMGIVLSLGHREVGVDEGRLRGIDRRVFQGFYRRVSVAERSHGISQAEYYLIGRLQTGEPDQADRDLKKPIEGSSLRRSTPAFENCFQENEWGMLGSSMIEDIRK
jgi:hypothetical protein